MKDSVIKAKNLKIAMLIILSLLIIGGGLGFYFALNQLRQLSIETSIAVSKNEKNIAAKGSSSKSSDQETENLVKLANEMLYSKTDFQNQAKSDLDKYAAQNGIIINSITLTDKPSNSQTSLPESISPERLVVSISSPVSFTRLMKFIKAVESNSPKIQPVNLNLSNIRANIGDVTVEPITIEVYTR